MKRLLRTVVLLLLAVWALALTSDEQTALIELRSSIPNLRALPAPWIADPTEACDSDYFEGVTCSDGPDPHVIGLYEAILRFGPKVGSLSSFSAPFSRISSLTRKFRSL